jgi:cytochrome c oxidase subunit IV
MAHTPEEVQKAVKKYYVVFAVLIAGTILTVAMYYVHLPTVAMTVTVAMVIASVKAFFVAGYFMHLLDEKKMIYGVLASTAFFLIGLMFLTIWAMHDFPRLTFLPTGPQ